MNGLKRLEFKWTNRRETRVHFNSDIIRWANRVVIVIEVIFVVRPANIVLVNRSAKVQRVIIVVASLCQSTIHLDSVVSGSCIVAEKSRWEQNSVAVRRRRHGCVYRRLEHSEAQIYRFLPLSRFCFRSTSLQFSQKTRLVLFHLLFHFFTTRLIKQIHFRFDSIRNSKIHRFYTKKLICIKTQTER